MWSSRPVMPTYGIYSWFNSCIRYHNISNTTYYSAEWLSTEWIFNFPDNEDPRIDMDYTSILHASTPSMFNSLWPRDATSWTRFESKLAQVMACCLTAPSHYQNQCWLITTKDQWHSTVSNFTRNTSAINHQNELENYSKMSFKSPRDQWVNQGSLLSGLSSYMLPKQNFPTQNIIVIRIQQLLR